MLLVPLLQSTTTRRTLSDFRASKSGDRCDFCVVQEHCGTDFESPKCEKIRRAVKKKRSVAPAPAKFVMESIKLKPLSFFCVTLIDSCWLARFVHG